MKKAIRLVAALAAATILSGRARAQDAANFPQKPVTIIVPYAPGGSTDAAARFIGPSLSKQFGQPVVVENRPGAAGAIGTSAVAKAQPDGHTLLVHTSVIGIHPAFNKNLPYDTQKDLVPVSIVADGPFVLVVNPKVPANNVKELLAYLKSKPGALNFGSAGAGSSGHLIGELFMKSTGTDMVHVPYNGGGPSQVGLMADEVQLVFDTLTSIPLIKDGRLKALAVTSNARWADLPDVPTLAEAGLPESSAVIWVGAFAPAGTPAPVVDKISKAIRMAVQDPQIVGQLKGVGMVPVGNAPAEATKQLADDIAKWKGLAAKGVTLQ